MIEIYLLEHLAAFEKYGTLSETAQSLHLTQPTLTRSMNKLEELFDVALFTREKKRLHLNENGKLAAKYASDILELQDQMVSQVRSLDRASHTIQIGSCAPGPLAELTAHMTRHFPGKTISTEIKTEDELIRGLKDKTYQLIILSHTLDEENAVSIPCGTESLYASLVPTHRLAKRKKISFKDMNGESFLMASEVGLWENIVRTEMPDSRFLLQSDLDALLEITVTSVLPGFVSDLTLRMYGERSGRISIPFSDRTASMSFYCVYDISNRDRFDGLDGMML